ncbi:MAG TPA: hypothetical protein VHT96_06860 [Clostridia bacterium]|nr:hypothetical protein [Clostridia bacterium]
MTAFHGFLFHLLKLSIVLMGGVRVANGVASIGVTLMGAGDITFTGLK